MACSQIGLKIISKHFCTSFSFSQYMLTTCGLLENIFFTSYKIYHTSFEVLSLGSIDSMIVSILNTASRNAASAAYLYVFGSFTFLPPAPLLPSAKAFFSSTRYLRYEPRMLSNLALTAATNIQHYIRFICKYNKYFIVNSLAPSYHSLILVNLVI